MLRSWLLAVIVGAMDFTVFPACHGVTCETVFAVFEPLSGMPAVLVRRRPAPSFAMGDRV
jgi:hypothetical protein